MAVDTPARIAILGAGPLGLEAALYARFLGYDIDVFERGEVADNIRLWGHVRMFTPFAMNSSSLARAAISAQGAEADAGSGAAMGTPSDAAEDADMGEGLPALDAVLTGRQWVRRYLLPLANTDLLADHIHTGRTVVSVGRQDLLKVEMPGDLEREESDFRLLTRDRSGREFVSHADIVIDATGVFGNPNWMGPGGTPAVGEDAARERIDYGLPDVLGTQRERYAGRHTLVVGSGYSAATTVVALSELAGDAPGTRVTWATRHSVDDQEIVGPLPRLPDDRLPIRDQLAERANRLATAGSPGLVYWPQTVIESIVDGRADGTAASSSEADSGSSGGTARFQVGVSGPQAGVHAFDRIVANVGYRPNLDLYRELQVHSCYATEGPIKLAAALLQHASSDCLDPVASEVEALRNPEPNFYILGSKSYGRNSTFLLASGLEQIRQLFALIGDRANLNLYETARSLPQ
jgi:hypothetical protein